MVEVVLTIHMDDGRDGDGRHEVGVGGGAGEGGVVPVTAQTRYN